MTGFFYFAKKSKMNIEDIREYCLRKKGATEDFPFDEVTLVMRVMGKIFALLPLDEGDRMNLKCDPEWAVELREKYEGVIPGFHMNKTHWNTVIFISDIPKKEVLQMIDHSYDLIVSKLKKSDREALRNLE